MPKLSSYTPADTPVLTDWGVGIGDPGGTPANVVVTWQSIMDLFEANIVLDTARIQSGTFADARIAQTNVTQHQAALTITESQISDLGAYITASTADTLTNKTFGDDIIFNEAADHSSTPAAGKGYLWVKNTAPSTIIFTDDTGVDTTLGAGGGGGINNVVEDTTPQLGGNLDSNAFAITRDYTNDNAGTATKGEAVYLKSNGNIDKARANTGATMPAIGLVAADIATTATGPVAFEGVLTNIDTSGLTAGAPVYVSSATAGALTSTRPTANAQIVAYCEVSNATTGVLRLALSPNTFDEIIDGFSFDDTNGNEIILFDVIASAVNQVQIGNAATGNSPAISATGGDANVGIDLVTKGDAPIKCSTGQRASLYIPAAAMISRTTTGAEAATTELATNDVMLETMNFDTAADEHVQFSFTMPKNWNAGTVSAVFYWSHPSTATNFGVAWAIQAVAFANDDALDTAFGTAVVTTDTGGTTDDLYISAESAAVTIAGTPAAEEMAYFQVYRDVSDAGDDLAVDARLHGVRIFYDVTALTED